MQPHETFDFRPPAEIGEGAKVDLLAMLGVADLLFKIPVQQIDREKATIR